MRTARDRHRHVELRPRIRVRESEDRRPRHNTNDFEPGQIRRFAWSFGCPVRRDVLPDRVLALKKSFRQRFVDDDDGLPSIDVVAIDAATLNESHAHRFEVAVGDRTDKGRWRRGTFWPLSPSHEHRIAIASRR
jgi:hypothetical protein